MRSFETMDDVLRKLEVKKFNLQVQGDGYVDLGTRVFGGPSGGGTGILLPPTPTLSGGSDWELVDSEDGQIGRAHV